MSIYKATGIVLHRIALGETDKIVTLLTREFGKLGAVAKGARRLTSKLGGATELFTYSSLLLATGKSLDVISQCEVRETFPALRSDLGLLARATYLCELTDRLIEEREPNPDVFDLLLSALYLLQRATQVPDLIVHAYELHLLAERGYTPALDTCVRCGRALGQQKVGFSPSLGGALCNACRYAAQDAITIGHETLRRMRWLQTAAAEELIRQAQNSEEAGRSDLRETGQCLRWYIRYRIDRDLKSMEFLDMLRMTG